MSRSLLHLQPLLAERLVGAQGLGVPSKTTRPRPIASTRREIVREMVSFCSQTEDIKRAKGYWAKYLEGNYSRFHAPSESTFSRMIQVTR
jgi:hypothetical protein